MGPPVVTVENRFDNVTMPLPEGFAFAKADAPVVNITVPEQLPPVVNVAAPIVNVPAPVVNLPEGFGAQAPQPPITINVPPAQVHVKATLDMPDTEAETTTEHDKQTGRIVKTRTVTRKAKK